MDRPRIAGITIVGLLVTSCASLELPPGPKDVAQLEDLRTIKPYLSSTKSGEQVAEFAPIAETRNTSCVAVTPADTFECRFQSRTKDFFAQEFGPWTDRVEIVERDRGGGWRFRQ